MGYKAYGSGEILLNDLSKKEYVCEKLETVFQDVDIDESANSNIWFERYSEYNYEESEIEKALRSIQDFVKRGHVLFTGEDDMHWAFIFKDGSFVEEDGDVYYESDIENIKQHAIEEYKRKEKNKKPISYNRLLEILTSYFNADCDRMEFVGGTLDSVREKLTDDCHCTREEIEALGFGGIFFD